MLIAGQTSHLSQHRKELERQLGDCVQLARPQTSCQQSIEEAMEEMKASSFVAVETVLLNSWYEALKVVVKS